MLKNWTPTTVFYGLCLLLAVVISVWSGLHH